MGEKGEERIRVGVRRHRKEGEEEREAGWALHPIF